MEGIALPHFIGMGFGKGEPGFFGGAFEESTRFLEEFEPLDVTPEGIGRDLIAP